MCCIKIDNKSTYFINRGMEFVLAMSCLGSFSNIAPLPLALLNSFAPLPLASLNSFAPLHIGDCSFSSSDISKLLSYEDSLLEMFIVSRLLLSGVGRLGLDKFAPMHVASLNNLATADSGDSSSTSDLLSYEDLLEILCDRRLTVSGVDPLEMTVVSLADVDPSVSLELCIILSLKFLLANWTSSNKKSEIIFFIIFFYKSSVHDFCRFQNPVYNVRRQ